MTHFIEKGRAPTVNALASVFQVEKIEMENALKSLQEYHGVVLHPASCEIWAMHPFPNAPTQFWIESVGQGWWGNCAWCALGAAALLERDVTVTTTLGGEAKQIVIKINGGEIINNNLFIHFPISMSKAWDNVTYTCSTMLMFESEAEIDSWCYRHGMHRGDVQPIDKIWRFTQAWYGNHLNPDWVKWSVAEAQALFERFELNHAIWQMPSKTGRF
jgi:hypothetical protein